MMKKKYTTTLNTRPFLYRETKMIAELIDQGLTDDVIKERVVEENILGLESKDRRLSFHNEIKKRLNQLDDVLFQNFLISDSQTSKLILLYGILSKDTLFYEWMREVVWDKMLTMDYNIKKTNTEIFFQKKEEQSEQVTNWKNITKDYLTDAYHQTLVESEIATRNDDVLRLHRPVIAPNVEQYLKNEKEKHIVEVLLGEVIQ